MNGFPMIIKPDEEDADAANIFVDVTINGNPYRFLLDTGAARTSTVFDAYTSTFASSEMNTSSGVFAHTKSSDDVVSVPRLELGPITFTNFPVVRLAAQRPGLQNLIGMDVLKHYRCYFFFDTQHVAIDVDDTPNDTFLLHDLFLDKVFHPYVTIQFGTVTGNAIWDTGAGITVADLNFIRTHPTFFQEIGRSHGTDATGHTIETPMFRMVATRIGNTTFPPHTVAGVDLAAVNATIEVPMDLILGYSTLRKANWLFDFPRKKWAVVRQLDME